MVGPLGGQLHGLRQQDQPLVLSTQPLSRAAHLHSASRGALPVTERNLEREVRPKMPVGPGAQDADGACGPIQVLCLPPHELWNGKCVPKCPLGLVHKMPDGACGPIQLLCLSPNEIWNGKCVPKCAPGAVHTLPSGACRPPPVMAPQNPPLFSR